MPIKEFISEVANETGLSEPYVYNVLNRSQTPTWRLAKRLALVTATDVELWLEGNQEELEETLFNVRGMITELAFATSLSVSFISQIINRKRSPGWETAKKLAEATGTKPVLWLEGTAGEVEAALAFFKARQRSKSAGTAESAEDGKTRGLITRLAQLTGLSVSFVGQVVNRKKNPSWKTAKLLSRVTGTEPILWLEGSTGEIEAALANYMMRAA